MDALIRRAQQSPKQTSVKKNSVYNPSVSQSQSLSSLPPTGDLCKAKSLPVVQSHNLAILHCNLNGWISHNSQLSGRLALLPERSAIICLNETLVHNDADLNVKLPKYGLIVRHAT